MVVPQQAVFVVLLVAIAVNLAIMAALIVAPFLRHGPRRDDAEESPPRDAVRQSGQAAFRTALLDDPDRDPRDWDGRRIDAHWSSDEATTADRPAVRVGLTPLIDSSAREGEATPPNGEGKGRADDRTDADRNPAASSAAGDVAEPIEPVELVANEAPGGDPSIGLASGGDEAAARPDATQPDVPPRIYRRGRRFRVPAHDDPRTSRAIQSFIDRRSLGRDDPRQAGAARRPPENPSAQEALGGGGRGAVQGSPTHQLRRDAPHAGAPAGGRTASSTPGRAPAGRGGAFDAVWPVDPLTGLGNRLAWDALVASEARLLGTGEPASVIVIELQVAAADAQTGAGQPDDTRSPVGEGRIGGATIAGAASWMPALAGALRSELRSTDLLARLAPSFVAGLLAGTSGDQALVVVERIRRVAEQSLASRRTTFRLRAGAADVAACGGIDAALHEATRRARLGDAAR